MNSHSDEIEVVRQLFQEHVPEVASGVVAIRGIVRKSGLRSILAVSSNDPAIDPVGVCVGSRGERAKHIVAALDMEHIDIVRWSEPTERFAANLLAPSRVLRVSFDEGAREATALLSPDSKLPGPNKASKLGLALRCELFLKLTGWRLKLELPNER